jgi:uncharacterized membrane protein YgdD (TMEM256/DUF423 family)
MFGAIGAHALKARLTPEALASWGTAVDYHLLHSVVLLALALYALAGGRGTNVPSALLLAGILLFSGSIYALALGGPRLLGPVTPLGGLCLIAAWLALPFCLVRNA